VIVDLLSSRCEVEEDKGTADAVPDSNKSARCVRIGIGRWYTPIEVYDDIADPVDRLVEGDADKTRLQVYRRGEDWYCTFNIEYDTDTSGETPIGVDTGERHILAVTAYGEDESMLVSGGEAKYVRRKYRSLREFAFASGRASRT